jgi:hypothetical protein
MANTFTNILPVLTKAAQVVSREAIGFTKAVTLDTSAVSGSLDQTVNVPKSPVATSATWAPSLAPTLGDTTATGVQLTLSTAKEVKWHVTAEQANAMDRGDATAMSWMERQSAQAFRTLGNAVDAYLFDLAYKASSRATGTAGTTPFTSNLDEVAALARILNDNGAPQMGRKLILNPAAYQELQERFSGLTSTAGRDLFEGGIAPIAGIQPSLSANVTAHTAGTGAAYLANKTAGWAVGDTTLNLDTGSGTILAGDVILATTGGRYYVVRTALSAGALVINDPGIRVAVANNGVITRQASYTPNVCLTPDAIYAIVRAPAQPNNLPNGWQSTIVVDPVSGIPFGVLAIPGDGVIHYSARILYGGVVVERGHIATLMG